jgi:predicted NBD/HSP70 family sugar kinase
MIRDEGGLSGALHLAPAWMFEGYDAILAADIGGTNIRAGVIEHRFKQAADQDVAKAHHARREGQDQGCTIHRVGCPGHIEPDGSVDRGAQNLSGDWESEKFNLSDCLQQGIPKIGRHATAVLMHNDAVVQGLSEMPYMQDVKHWGMLTIGTGLGNARFTNRG